MTERGETLPTRPSWLLIAGMWLGGVAGVGGVVAMLVLAIEKIRNGQGLDTYRTLWLVEFNWIGFPIFVLAIVLAMTVGLFFWWKERREIRALLNKYSGMRRPVTTWRAATLKEVQQLLTEGISDLHPLHRAQFAAIRVDPQRIPVADSPGEFVFAVARHEGKLLYYSDIEEGWELEAPNASGGIDARGCNQFELTHVMHRTFGDPCASPPNPSFKRTPNGAA